MKLSIIARSGTWHTDQLIEQGKRRGIEVELVNFKSLNGWQKMIEQLGEVVLWRSSSLDMPLGRSIMMQRIDAKRVLFNRSLAYENLLAHKLYQQKAINPLKTITGIPTYAFRGPIGLKQSIKEGHLQFPIVMKKNLSARGEGVHLIQSIEDIKISKKEYKEYIFQNFVKNDGDVRILVLGGVALGAMKRIKADGNWKNNISQGAEGVDASKLFDTSDLRNKALSIASKFGLQFAGVDFIFDQEAKIWRFMEVNTVPQWQGFSAATGVDVTNAVLDYVEAMGNKEKNLAQRVSNYYARFEKFLRRSDLFHLYSRLYLIKGDESAKAKLTELKDWYLGEDEQGIEKRLQGLMETVDEGEAETPRKQAYQKYPKLLAMNNLLFWWLMAREVYGEDKSEVVGKHFSDEELRSLANDLMADEETLYVLSSASMNFLYLLEAYLGIPVNAEKLYQINKNEGNPKGRDLIKRAFYYLSHLIIAGSHFYTKKNLEGAIFEKALRDLEELVRNNYFECSLDMKLELLVCAQILGKKSELEAMIRGEAARSVSNIGNFVVDIHNAWKHGFGHKLGRSEHRNALLLMIS